MTTTRTGSGSREPRTYVHLASARDSKGVVRCLKHGLEARKQISGSPTNPNRTFFNCQIPECNFFWWAHGQPPSPSPAQLNPKPEPGEQPQQSMTALGKRRAPGGTPEPQTPSKRVARTPSSKETPEQKQKRFLNIQLALQGADMDSAKTKRALLSAQKQVPLPSIDQALREARSPLSKTSPDTDPEDAALWASFSPTIGSSHQLPGSVTSSRAVSGISSAGYYGAGPSRTPARGLPLTPPPSSPFGDDLASQSSSIQVSQALGSASGADKDWEAGEDEDNPFYVPAVSVPCTPVKASRVDDMREHVDALSEMADYVEKLERKARASEKSLQSKNSIIAALQKENEELKAKLASSKHI